MTISLPSWAQPSCANINTLSFAYGAATSVTGLDQLFTGLGAPPAVHWALGGAAANYQCKGKISFDRDYAMSLAAAYGGGFVATMLLGR